jgi:hypothetical protein
MRWARHVACMGEMRKSYKIWLENPSWDDNVGIKMDLKEMGCGDVDWIHLAQDMVQWLAFVVMVINLCDL